jgi:probable HAF family extracellular repeat protein
MAFAHSLTAARSALAAATLAFAGGVVAAPLYSIQKLDRPEGVHPDNATAISDNGIVVGFGRIGDGPYTAPLIRRHHKTHRMESPDREFPEVWSVNKLGESAGHSSLNSTAVIWDSTGHSTDLDSLIPCDADDGGRNTSAVDINNNSEVLVALECWEQNWFNHAFVYHAGTVTPIGDLGGGDARANDINNLGQVVGISTLPPDGQGKSASHAFVWDKGVMRDLGTLGGGKFSNAKAINDLGHMAVIADDQAGKVQLYLHDGTSARKLHNCNGDRAVYPVAINNHDDIVANTEIEQEGYLFQNGHCYHLIDLLDASGTGWEWLTINDINHKGVIVGHGFLNRRLRGFIATPVRR